MHKRELEILAAISESLNSAPTVRDALDRTLALVAELFELDIGWVWLVNPETGHIYSAAARNLPEYLQEPVRMTGASCWCIEQFRHGELTAANVDVMECSRLRPAVRAHATEVAHHASVPLYFQDKALGILNVTAPAMRRLSARELRLLSVIGLQLGVAIERARLADESAVLARADERTRLAREIHDTIAQGLTAIGLQIESALDAVGKDPERVRTRLRNALGTTRASLDEARRSVMNLRAEPLAGKPLEQALAALVREFISESGIQVTFDAACDRALPLAVEAELYRIAEQALANVRQHAHAKSVRIVFRCTKRGVTLSVEDDGVGFDPRRIPDERHGVRGMRERARLAGGRLTIASGKRGTRIRVRVAE
ncbi:MAG TPA: GAF domain-containing sensor histidine kinase [Thermoanaerobaculia bacterium]|nr:GAF domain-containing sensor histidine kinase [Thermoanaerobaculia bacterium]